MVSPIAAFHYADVDKFTTIDEMWRRKTKTHLCLVWVKSAPVKFTLRIPFSSVSSLPVLRNSISTSRWISHPSTDDIIVLPSLPQVSCYSNSTGDPSPPLVLLG